MSSSLEDSAAFMEEDKNNLSTIIATEFAKSKEGSYMERAQHRRRLLMAVHGGHCSKCGLKVDFNRKKNSFWEFDHIYDRHTFKVSPRSDIKQFTISGSNCGRRSIELVVTHCILDTRLLCKVCHKKKSHDHYWDPTATVLGKKFIVRVYKDLFGEAPSFIKFDD